MEIGKKTSMGSLPSSLCILFSYDFIYLFLAVLGLHCYIGFFSSSRKQGQLSSCGAQASHCCGFCHRLSCGGAQTGSRAQGLQEFQLLASQSALFIQSCLTVCSPTDCSPPGYSVHRILQARILEWVAIPLSKRSSQPRDRTWALVQRLNSSDTQA